MKKHMVTLMSCIFITLISPQMTFAHSEEDDGHEIQEVIKKFQEDSIKTENQKNEQKTEEGNLDDAHIHNSNSEGTKHEAPNTKEAIHDEEHKGDLVNEDDGGHTHGNKEYVDVPPNYKALSAFAAINLIFIFWGLWIKRLRKKNQHL